VKRNLRLEDFILGATIVFTFLYPLIITGIILYQEAKKEERALRRLEKIVRVLTREGCRERVLEVAPYTEVSPETLRGLCSFTEGKKVRDVKISVEGEEVIYRAELNGGYLTLVGIWEMNRFRIIFIGYDKGR